MKKQKDEWIPEVFFLAFFLGISDEGLGFRVGTPPKLMGQDHGHGHATDVCRGKIF